MATFEQISELRGLTGEPDNVDPWTDSTLDDIIDTNGGDVRKAASAVWTTKAANAAHLVDISEGGSSRKMSDVYKNALEMARVYAAPADIGLSGVRRATTRAIERP